MMIKSWRDIISPFLSSETGEKVKNFVIERRKFTTVYPQQKDIFRCMRDEICMPHQVKLVILADQPYDNESSDGYAFSSNSNETPKLLQSVFNLLHKDLYSYLKVDTFSKEMSSNSLEKWAKQGVLLLNISCTSEKGEFNQAHKEIGWQELTTNVIKEMGRISREPTVFMLWGKEAKSFSRLIMGDHHLILEAASIEEATGHFAKANGHLCNNRPEKELLSTPFDMRKYIDLEGLIEGIKGFIAERKIPIEEPHEKLTHIFNEMKNDYLWNMKYSIDFLTKNK